MTDISSGAQYFSHRSAEALVILAGLATEGDNSASVPWQEVNVACLNDGF